MTLRVGTKGTALILFQTIDSNGGILLPADFRRTGLPARLTAIVENGTVARLETPSIVFQPGQSTMDLEFRGLAPGTTTITLRPPAGFAPTTQNTIRVTVTP